jgi:hypothetical protein
MSTLSRRRFLIFAGAGIVAVAAGGAALAIRQFTQTGPGSTVTFRAITGLPRAPLPSYASYVIEGHVDKSGRSGTITKTVFAGPPQERQPIALLARTVRVTDVQEQGGQLSVTGMVDASGLQQGEPSAFKITFDSSHRAAQADFFGSPIQLQVETWESTP